MKTSDYLKEYREIKDRPVELKAAILASFTLKQFKEVMIVEAEREGMAIDIFESDYGKYFQEIIDKQSELYKFKANIVYIFIDIQSLLGDAYFQLTYLSINKKKKVLKEAKKQIQFLIENLCNNTDAKIIVNNFEVPFNSPLGIVDNKEVLGLIEFIEGLNVYLRVNYKSSDQVYVYDYNSLCSGIGKREVSDNKMYYLADIKFDFKHYPKLAKEYLVYIRSLLGRSKKCLVLDLDNTLWGGVLGEDGIGGIELGPTPRGRVFLEMQKYIYALYKRGVILSICSKNNYKDVMQVFKEHTHMILKEEYFASLRINWNDKVVNIKEIAKEINIGLDSLVFLDDDHLNRDLVSLMLPEVTVINMPEDASNYLETISSLNLFDSMQITKEDRKKGDMYVAQRKRKEFKGNAMNMDDYLAGLSMEVDILAVDESNIQRVSQLTKKTNQFNMTTKRMEIEEIQENIENNLVFVVKVKDKFGDNGVTGVSIVNVKKGIWEIEVFLLSCRVIGRKVESVMLAHICEKAKKNNIKKIGAKFIKSKKNKPAENFYPDSGFKLIKDGEEKYYELDLNKNYQAPDYIKVNKHE